jgi:hypothetical protein
MLVYIIFALGTYLSSPHVILITANKFNVKMFFAKYYFRAFIILIDPVWLTEAGNEILLQNSRLMSFVRMSLEAWPCEAKPKPKTRAQGDRISLWKNRPKCCPTRVARWFILKPKIHIWVQFGGPWNGKCWCMYFITKYNIFPSFGIIYGRLL